ncbi:hypothetical protein AAC387_Pa04g1602 [Persea americana]
MHLFNFSHTTTGTLNLGEVPTATSLEPKTCIVAAPRATPFVSVAPQQASHGMQDTGLNHNSTSDDLQQIDNKQDATLCTVDATSME